MVQRLDKLVASQGSWSRSDAQRCIRSGAVTVDGSVCRDPSAKVDPDGRQITVAGRLLRYRQYQYIMLNKPPGILCVSRDPKARTVVDLVPEPLRRKGLFPAGRLDKDTVGLVLLTDDGDFANHLMHPRYHIPKVYRATVRPDFTEEQAVALLEGLVLDGDKLAPVQTRVITKEPNRAVIELVLHEGKNRQIRRMCEQLGLEVARLRRVAVGPLRLGMLEPGKWRDLKKDELEALRRELNKAENRQEAAEREADAALRRTSEAGRPGADRPRQTSSAAAPGRKVLIRRRPGQ